MGRALLIPLITACVLGCSDDESSPDSEPPSRCALGEWPREDGSCIPAGLPPDMPCPPGEWLHADGTCILAGVPPDGCGEGFAHDGDRGCEPILPPEPCPPGLMSVPGETTCREVAPCAAGTWGDIPVEPDTEYVDIGYAGMDSDGSALKPWTSIQAAVDAAAPDALVAVAAGSYLEDVTVSKPVRLWGVCPALVEVVGSGAEIGAVVVLNGADGSEVRGLALRGAANGFGSSGSLDVVLDRVWLHDNAGRGVDAENALGPTSVLLQGVLVEENRGSGVFSAGSEVTIEAGVVRTTQPDIQGSRGINVQRDPFMTAPATLVLRHSLVEQNEEVAIAVLASTATLESSVVRFTEQTVAALGGGVAVLANDSGTPATLLLQRSVIEQNQGYGIFAQGSDASVDASVVRTTLVTEQGGGRGVTVQPYPPTGTPATLLLQHSLIEQNYEVGLLVAGSEATIEASVVRHTLPDTQGLFGRGISVQDDPMTGASSTLSLESSLIEHNVGSGVFLSASTGTVKNSIVAHTQSDVLGLFGHAVSAQANKTTHTPATLLLQSSLLEDSRQAGVLVFGSNATIESCLIRDTLPNGPGNFGDAIAIGSLPGPANVTITSTHIHNSARAAVSAWGAHAALGGSVLTCHAFALNRESFEGVATTLEDLGGNLCGCPGATTQCKAVSANLEPPSALEPAPE